MADIITHNGFITITNPKTGTHETYHVSTDKKSGVRTISRVSQYLAKMPFATIADDGTISLLPAYRHERYKGYLQRARLLAHPEAGQRWGLIYQAEGCCRRCNAVLTHPDSITLGIGPICRAHLDLDAELARLKTMDDNALVGEWRGLTQRDEHELARLAWACIRNPDLKAALRARF
jgi:hypothetical protein